MRPGVGRVRPERVPTVSRRRCAVQPIELRTPTTDEALALERLAHSRTAPARAVGRACISTAGPQLTGLMA
jgi:hypothetical protein